MLGIWVGYQSMARGSEEGRQPGLGWLDASVKRFPSSWEGAPLRVPHVGWNRLTEGRGPLLEQLDHDPRFYFTHSYYVDPDSRDISVGVCHYGLHFAAAVQKGRIYGVQFHPEKSHGVGLSLIRNFVDRC